MKLIFKIARTELRNLFYSPIAWFLTIAFFVECAVIYTNLLMGVTKMQEMGGFLSFFLNQLTDKIFTSRDGGLFNNIMQNLYLYIPLLTMGLISREINSGTISLLYSSPVKVREMVLGKYVAMMIYSFVLLVIIAIFITSGVFNIKDADVGMLLSALLGFYLILCAYSAIGLFMSTLTSYQIVAAISSFIVIGALSYVGRLWQGVNFVRDLTYFLSLNGRAQHMLTGLITTKDVIYFIVIVYMFLGFSILKLKDGRESRPVFIKCIRYAFVVASGLVVGYISSLPGFIGYWDTTAQKNNTLTLNTQKIVRELGDAPLEITLYNNLIGDQYYLGMPDQRNNYLARWEPFLRFKPNIKFSFVNYYDSSYDLSYNIYQFYPGKTLKQIAEQKAKGDDLKLSDFLSPEQIRKEIDLKPEMNRTVMQLKYNGKVTYLRLFNDQIMWPFESEISAALKRLLQDTMPKVDFLTGNGERSISKNGDREYKTISNDKVFRNALINQGFDIDTLSLETRDIPDNISALVIADPTEQLSSTVTDKVEHYISAGGNVLIIGEPGRQNIINPILASIGVQEKTGMLQQKNADYGPNFIRCNLTKSGIGLSELLKNPVTDTLPVDMSGVASLIYNDSAFHIEPLLETRGGLVNDISARNPDLDIAASDSATQKYSSFKQLDSTVSAKIITDSGNTNKYVTAISLTRKINDRQQRIIVLSDADFMSNSELKRTDLQTNNFSFTTSIFSWLDYNQFPIITSRPAPIDNHVKVSSDQVSVLKLIYVWLLPAFLLIFGLILLIRRKRK